MLLVLRRLGREYCQGLVGRRDRFEQWCFSLTWFLGLAGPPSTASRRALATIGLIQNPPLGEIQIPAKDPQFGMRGVRLVEEDAKCHHLLADAPGILAGPTVFLGPGGQMKSTPDARLGHLLLFLPSRVAKGVDGDHRQEIPGFGRERALLDEPQDIFADAGDTAERICRRLVSGSLLGCRAKRDRYCHRYTTRFLVRLVTRHASGVCVACARARNRWYGTRRPRMLIPHKEDITPFFRATRSSDQATRTCCSLHERGVTKTSKC